MSISTVVTRGYGTWGSVNKLPTWGYAIGAAVIVYPVDGWRTNEQKRLAIATARTRLFIAKAKNE